ncbi:MAG TPA: hypothetical protein DIT04_03600 [Dysgonomonas sp.]|nr:hypothetical protein [Dysgonomonas sp.]
MSLRPNKERSKRAVTMVWLVMAFYILNVMFEVLEKIYYPETTDLYGYYEEYDSVGYTGFYLLYTLTSFGYIIFTIISAVTFIQWFRRAYFNLHEAGVPVNYSEKWAALGWFIPIANIFVPYRIMKELHTKTYGLLNQGEHHECRRPNISRISIWWALWIFTGIIETISFRIYRFDEADIASTYLSVIACILTIPLTFVTVNLINDYSDYEDALANVNSDSDFITQEKG